MTFLKTFTRTERLLLLFFAFLKLLLHLFTNQKYGLHRDEYLYWDQGNHLGWGFFEVPPFTPFVGKLATLVFGDNVFALRLFPALAGVVVVILIGLMVKEMGGKKWAITFASLAYVLSPAFLRSNTLFQPVCFNQMWWAVAAFILLKIVHSKEKKHWYWLGAAVGLGWMTKYSIAFFMLALMLGFLVTSQRKWLATKQPYIAIGIAFLIALPNLIWQYNFGFPVIHHMSDLAATQLVNVKPSGFILSQISKHGAGFLIWFAGLLWLFSSPKAKSFRYMGWAFVFLIIMLLLLSGKSYYASGVYPMLMAAGGVAIEQFFKNRSAILKYVFVALIMIPNLYLLPDGLPVLPVEKLGFYYKKIAKFGFAERWEDGEIRPLPQDYADMHGWEELAQKVAKKFHSLPEGRQETCLIWGGGYAHASSLNFYRKKYGLPKTFSLNSSYLLWAEQPKYFDNMILVNDVWSESSSFFYHHELVDSIADPYAREVGYIFYRDSARINLDSALMIVIREEKEAAGNGN